MTSLHERLNKILIKKHMKKQKDVNHICRKTLYCLRLRTLGCKYDDIHKKSEVLHIVIWKELKDI